MRLGAIALALFGFGCHSQLGAGASVDVDASGGGSQLDSGSGSSSNPDAASTSMPDGATAATCTTGRQLYLNFEGATLTRATTSDATQNHAAWMGVTSATMPGYHANSANRAQLIIDVTNAVKAGLANFPDITVTTARPTAGLYVMIGFGGVESTVNIPYRYAVMTLDCTDTVKSDLGWVFDDAGTSQKAADLAIGAVGFGMGLTGTSSPSDCMCGWLTQCQQLATACTLSASIPALNNCAMNPQNEVAKFQAFCN
jgi:hypothetical protein